MESLVGEIASLQNQQLLLTSAMDDQIQSIRQHYQAQLTAQNEAFEQKMQIARLWAEANPDEFGPARSIEALHGAVGWRTGQPP
jgi:phage host-nuclease inhibitor protein Gam